MKKTNKNNKNYSIYLSNVYKITTVTLLVCIILLGLLYINANGEDKCKEVKIEQKEIVNPNVVFFGDSITDYYHLDEYYPDLKKVNSGISGNRTCDLKNDMYNRVYRYNPSTVVLLIGINNFLYSRSSVDEVVGDIKEITKEIHENLPNCEIIVQSIYPVNDDWRLYYNSSVPELDEVTNKIMEANDRIKEMCSKEHYFYVDMFYVLKDKDNHFDSKYTDDGLHPNENGYKEITKIIKKYL